MTVVPVTLNPEARVRIRTYYCIWSDYFHKELYDTVEQLSKDRIEGLMRAGSLTVCEHILTAVFNY